MATSRDEMLRVLAGQRLTRLPVFSGLPSLTAPALRAAGLRYPETHTEAGKMAAAAASTFEMFGFESAVVPFDLCVEAEVLGGGVDFQTDSDAFLPPFISTPLDTEQPLEHLGIPERLDRAGRLPLVAEALRRLKAGIGRQVVVGAWVPGPFTLAWQLFGTAQWLSAYSSAEWSNALLAMLEHFIARVAAYYREAGADFITVHEMGGSPQVLGMRQFRAWVKPSLQRLLAKLPAPTVLSVCGRTNGVVTDLAECGADALNVDHLNDLAQTRVALGPSAVLLGNFDPLNVLSQGTPELITETVRAIAAAGANAVWPGCDLWPDIPEANLRALMAAASLKATLEDRSPDEKHDRQTTFSRSLTW